MNALLIAPILFPLILGLLTIAFWKYRNIQRIINLIGSFVFLIIGFLLLKEVLSEGIQSFQSGSWIAPYGITIIADTFSAIMVFITSFMALIISIYSISSMGNVTLICAKMLRKRRQFSYYPLLNIMYMGICGAFLTGDLFNMYVWFEVLLISSFILLAMDGTKEQLAATFKYVTINLVSSAFFLIGIGFVYGMTGTLNLADLAVKIPELENQALVTLVSVFFLICFGIKAAVFPLFFWLPASYHTPPISIAAIFAGMLTKVGVYSLIRVFTLLFVQDVGYTHNILLWIAGFTMLVGVLGAASHFDMRRILAFHSISQIGYMIAGLALYTPLAIAGAIFFMIHHTLVKGNLFLVAGLVNKVKGNYDIRNIGGIANAYPFLAVLFLIPALSLAGIPPLSGFWAKFFIVKPGLETGEYIMVATALFVGLITLYSMIKIWTYAFWSKDPGVIKESIIKQRVFSKENVFMTIPIICLIIAMLATAFYPEPFFQIAQKASNELINTTDYVNAVLGGNAK